MSSDETPRGLVRRSYGGPEDRPTPARAQLQQALQYSRSGRPAFGLADGFRPASRDSSGDAIDRTPIGAYDPPTTEYAYQEWRRDRPCEARQPTDGDVGTVPNPGRSSCEIRSPTALPPGSVSRLLGLRRGAAVRRDGDDHDDPRDPDPAGQPGRAGRP